VDNVLVALTPRPGDPDGLENAILTVRRQAMDAGAADRVTGDILDVDPAPRTLRAALPVLAGSPVNKGRGA